MPWSWSGPDAEGLGKADTFGAILPVPMKSIGEAERLIST
jgi:hypothetical protein